MTRNLTTDDAELITAFLDWMAAGQLSPNTVRNRKYLLHAFAARYGLTTATPDDVQAHLAGLRSAASMSSHLAALRTFYRWGIASGRLDDDPTVLVHRIRVPHRDKEPVPKVVLDRALALHADEETRFALLLGARAGLRREEIATFSDRCIMGEYLVIIGKGNKQRRIYAHPELRPYLDDLQRSPGWAFPSSRMPGCHVTPETIQRRVTAALGEPWTTHSLRRRFAYDAYRATRDLRAVQELLGHADPATTAIYCRADEDTMRAAVLAVA